MMSCSWGSIYWVTQTIVVCLSVFLSVISFPTTAYSSQGQAVKSHADAGQLWIESHLGESKKHTFLLRGPESRHQLIVTLRQQPSEGSFAVAERKRDMTRLVTYQSAPAGIVQIDETGYVKPLANGQATISVVGPGGRNAYANVTVVEFDTEKEINFADDVVPVFTKLGCNSGGCHGKSDGQNGFKLSLLGFEPSEDYEYLVQEARGRRLFPASPQRSLLLLKATATVPHSGGVRMKEDSQSYKMLRQWIAQGMPYRGQQDATLQRIQVLPEHRILPAGGSQQVSVLAHYSDGSVKDVTRMAQYEASEMAGVERSPSGHMTVGDTPGDIAVMVRYSTSMSVFTATIPLGADVGELPEPKNFIDEHIFEKLQQLGLPPSPVCDDATFLRRTALDIAGRLPSVDETIEFLGSTDPGKRGKWIDRLVDSQGYSDYFANKWSAILRNMRFNDRQKRGNYALHGWVKQSLAVNKPYDEFVRDIVAASGKVVSNPPTVWYSRTKDIKKQMEDMSQLFLGVRMQCAQCHHHPFERWSRQDYYGLAAFFSQVGRKEGPGIDQAVFYHKRGIASTKNPKTDEMVHPTPLGDEPLELSPDSDPRQALVDWMVREDNPFFAHALVNRYWKHFFNRGLVHPEDDLRATNPPSHPQLLDKLAAHFVDSGYDLKALVRLICRSTAYQLASQPNSSNGRDRQNFARYYPRRLNAEVLLDAINTVTEGKSSFKGLPPNIRAVQLPDSGVKDEEGDFQFLKIFGRPAGSSVCECERADTANLAQSLHLLNAQQLQQKLTSGRAKKLGADQGRADPEKIRELYLLAFSRPPGDMELANAIAYLSNAEQDKKHELYEDVLWAMINTKQFMFNH